MMTWLINESQVILGQLLHLNFSFPVCNMGVLKDTYLR